MAQIPSSPVVLTLPLSCAICIDKVRNPVVCPTGHVFCQRCTYPRRSHAHQQRHPHPNPSKYQASVGLIRLGAWLGLEPWLARHSHCPTCRVEITVENPCKVLLGGHIDEPSGAGSRGRDESERERRSRQELRSARLMQLVTSYDEEMKAMEVQTTHRRRRHRLGCRGGVAQG